MRDRLAIAAGIVALTLVSYFQFPAHTYLGSDTQIYAPMLDFRAAQILGVFLLAASCRLTGKMSMLATSLFTLGAAIVGPAVLTFEYEPVPRGPPRQDWVNTDQVRIIVKLKGNRLTLRTSPIVPLTKSGRITQEVVWERMAPDATDH